MFEGGLVMLGKKKINTLTLISLIFTLAILFVLKTAMPIRVFGAESYKNTTTYCVKEGDTLWQLANQFARSQSKHEWIESVSEQNNIVSYRIFPGQLLDLPQYE